MPHYNVNRLEAAFGPRGPYTRERGSIEGRIKTIREEGIMPRQISVRFNKGMPGWPKGRILDVLGVTLKGKLEMGYRKTNHRVGIISPHHPRLTFIPINKETSES